jgi:hypothetical protein
MDATVAGGPTYHKSEFKKPLNSPLSRLRCHTRKMFCKLLVSIICTRNITYMSVGRDRGGWTLLLQKGLKKHLKFTAVQASGPHSDNAVQKYADRSDLIVGIIY